MRTPRALLVPTVIAALLAVVPAPSGAVAATAQVERPAARAAAPAWTATVKVSRPSIDVGSRVVVSGKVRPAVRGTVVKLQKRLEGRSWVAEATLRTTATGSFSYSDSPTTAGKRAYRVVVPATKKRAKGTSASAPLTVFRWVDLTKVKSRASNATRSDTSIMVNGVAYDRGFAGYTSYYREGFVDWNFAKRCTSLRARFGNGDDSDDTATAGVELVVDGNPVYTGSFALTESAARTINITNAFRVAFKWTSSNVGELPDNQAGAEAVMVDPMVRCSF